VEDFGFIYNYAQGDYKLTSLLQQFTALDLLKEGMWNMNQKKEHILKFYNVCVCVWGGGACVREPLS
jgi:hypothetical protein